MSKMQRYSIWLVLAIFILGCMASFGLIANPNLVSEFPSWLTAQNRTNDIPKIEPQYKKVLSAILSATVDEKLSERVVAPLQANCCSQYVGCITANLYFIYGT